MAFTFHLFVSRNRQTDTKQLIDIQGRVLNIVPFLLSKKIKFSPRRKGPSFCAHATKCHHISLFVGLAKGKGVGGLRGSDLPLNAMYLLKCLFFTFEKKKILKKKNFEKQF